MANTSISNLAAGAAVSATDLIPNVQTAGVGPVKTTAAQLKTFMSASPTLVTPALGTPSSGDFSTGTFTWPTFNQNTTGTAAGLSVTLNVASGGTGLTSLTAGRIPFGAGTSAFGNSANLFWDSANENLGVGTTALSATKLGVNGNIATIAGGASGVAQAAGTFYYDTVNDFAAISALHSGVSWKPITFRSLTMVFRSTADGEAMRLDASGNLLIGTSVSPTTGTQCLTIETGTAATATPADTITIYSTDRTAGNTIPSIYCEGSGVTNAAITNVSVTNKIAMRVNGTIYYLLATTSDA